MQKKAFVVAIFLLGLMLASAHGEDFAETKRLIDSGISCDELTEEQLEQIGDYYMERMHPGEAHEMMHEMMGGEDSASVRQMHVTMAKGLYCNEDAGGMTGATDGGMMGCGMMSGGNMMSNVASPGTASRVKSGGMMDDMMWGNPMGPGWWLWGVIWLLFWVGVVAFIAWLAYKFVERPNEEPLEILKKRFAKGEMTKKEFEQMKKELS